jgi:hypothetical protein
MTDPHTPVAEPKSLDEALLMLQADPPVLTKSKKGQVGNQITRYADLPQVNAQVLSRLNALGVIWKCKPMMVSYEGAPPQFVLRYKLTHVPTGEYEEGDYPLKLAENPQQMGSAITYSRRYALLAITGIAAEDEDNDGDTPGGRAPAQRRPAQKRTAMTPAAEPTAGAQSPAVPLPSEETSRAPGQKDRRALEREAFALFREMGVGGKEDKEARLLLVQNMLGREVTTFNDLNDVEVRGSIDAMRKALKTDNAMSAAVEIYQRTTGAGGPAADVDPELIAAIKAGQWKKVQFYADDPGGYGPNIDAAKGALAGANVRERPEPSGHQPGQRSRNAAEAIGNGGDEGAETAPWEGELPV